jgi:hypothetical protein
MAWTDRLAEFLRLNDGQQAYTGYPQMQVGLNQPRQAGAITGFLENATGLPTMQPVNPITDPNYAAYAQGQNYGDLASAALMAAPAAILAKTLRTSKTVDSLPKLDIIGQKLQNRLESDYPGLVKQYEALKDAEGGKLLNTDVARELSPEYIKNRTLSANVHEPASSFIKQRYAEILQNPYEEGASVLFTGGGTGAGKTSSLKAYPDLRKNAEIIYDTNMNKLESAQKKIDQALEAGRKVDLVYTYRDPIESLVEGSLKRAMRMKEELGSGRTVPLKEHIRTHVGSRDVIKQLENIYGENPNVRIGIIDNRYGQANPKVAQLQDLPELDAKQLEKDLRKALNEQYKAGKIDKDVYESSK